MENGDLLMCPCGSGWFRLAEAVVDHGRMAGALSMNRDGTVAAWSGALVCVECGTPMVLQPEQELAAESALRLVQ